MRLNYRQIGPALAGREEFQGNSMSAEWMRPDQHPAWGWLPKFYVDLFMADLHVARVMGENVYVVYSYGTPIAWAYGTMVRVPEVKYSVTTSKQQGKLYHLT